MEMKHRDQGTTRPASDVAFTAAVKTIQERLGSRSGYRRMEEGDGWSQKVTPDLEDFIAERDSLYLGTANAEGQPYIQHRGGKRGFLKVIDERRLALADFSGNRQYISMGNLSENDKAFLFLMDYPNQRRIKLWGRAEFVEDDAELLERLVDADYEARPERALVFHVEAWDVNCPQHITPRFTRQEIEPAVRELERRNAALQERVDRLESQISDGQKKP
jgi:predicted pyridoxine 5'-phosphate oxidase superfamily flavin-nucleotide-binding protein